MHMHLQQQSIILESQRVQSTSLSTLEWTTIALHQPLPVSQNIVDRIADMYQDMSNLKALCRLGVMRLDSW